MSKDSFTINRIFKMSKGGLRRRFLSYMILLILLLMIGVFVLVEKNSRAVILEEGRKRGLSNALYLGALSTSSLLMYDYTKLEQNVDEVAKEPDVVYAIILDKKGVVLAHSGRDDLSGKLLDDPLSKKATASDSHLVQDYRHPETGEEIWDIAYPIFQQQNVKWGTVRIGFSLKTLRGEIAQNRKNLVILSLLAILLAGGVATFLAERITGPIRKLSDRAIAISRGDLNNVIHIDTGDEIEELAETFNSMTRELAKNHDRQKRLIRELSKKNLLLKQEIETRERLEGEIIKVERLRALGEMSGGVAHDFNNILGAILGYAQLLLEKVEEQGIRKGLKIIEKAALDGAETVRRIQEFTRVRVDSSSFIAMDINEVISDAIEFTKTRWKNEAEAWGINIDVSCELGNIPVMMGDPSSLREVFTNLIINAVDAMPEGGTIHIRTFQDGDIVTVAVSDTGIGMSTEVQKRAFDPFFTTKGTRGSGLGLSICFGIIARHRGEINLTSSEREGTTFTILIPMSLLGKEEASPHPAIDDRVSQARVLVIDDDEIIRAAISEILTTSGCLVDEVKSGSEGLDLLAREEYDIVLTDLGMEGMSGWEVARIVKERSPMTTVVLITGWGTQLDEEETKRRGIDFVVSKPFKVRELKELIQRVMALKGK